MRFWTAPSAIVLILSNLVPLAGVLFWGWDLFLILFLYWAESAVIGFYAILRIVVVTRAAALFVIPFFIVHYGIFMFVHGLTLLGLFSDGNQTLPEVLSQVLGHSTALLSIGALVFSHGFSFLKNFIAGSEYATYQKNNALGLISQSYKRIVIMHLSLLFGAIGVQFIGASTVMLVLLVILKIVSDLFAHTKEHYPLQPLKWTT